jgi:hypothetical protein
VWPGHLDWGMSSVDSALAYSLQISRPAPSALNLLKCLLIYCLLARLLACGSYPGSWSIFGVLAHFQGLGSFALCAGIGRKETDSETCELRSDRTRRRTSAFLGASFGLCIARQLANAARRDGSFFGSGLIFRGLAHFRGSWPQGDIRAKI